MLRYQVRSRALVDLIADVRRRRLVISPYFQRDLVWRTIHKVDFIDTILSGLPFPQIFLAKGDIDIESMTSTSCVVDGQQRLNAIMEYINGNFSVHQQRYQELPSEKKEEFLKYEIPIIELDLRHDDPTIIEIFKRLNRTFYSLSNIEKLSTEYAASEFMLVAKFLCGDLQRENTAVLEEYDDIQGTTYTQAMTNPIIPASFYEWAKKFDVEPAHNYILGDAVFTAYEISRKVPLMFTLNVLGTLCKGSFYARNEEVISLLNGLESEFPEKDEYSIRITRSCDFINRMKLDKDSYWNNKANSFSLLVCLVRNFSRLEDNDPQMVKATLEEFAAHAPEEYRTAAKEAVNNKRERITRNRHLETLLFGQ